jgi:hypothetical protein
MKKPTILCSTLMLLSMGSAHGFLPNKPNSFIRTAPSNYGVGNGSHITKRKTALNDVAAIGVLDPSIEAELCTTMAHVALDFTSLASPSRSLMRLFAVIGRVFAISADYLPDHSIHTEELMIQVFLLSLALRELFSDKLGAFVTAQVQENLTNSSKNMRNSGKN